VSRTKSVGLTLLFMVSGAGVPMFGSADATPPELAAGTVVGIRHGAAATVSVGAEEVLPNGDVVVHPLSATAVDGTSFRLTGPLAAPATRNPDGSVPLDVQVTGAGRTKVFNLNALPPDATHAEWRWSGTPDTDLVAGHSDAVAGTRLSGVALDMAHAAAAPSVRATTDVPTVAPTVTAEMRREATRTAGATRSDGLRAATDEITTGMNCNSSTWTARYPAEYEKRWVPVQRIKMSSNATQTYGWSTSQGTQMQVAYVGPDDAWKGGFRYSTSRGSVTGFTAPVTTAYWAGYLKTRWRFLLQDQYCASTTWPYGAVRSGVHRWYPKNWDGSAMPVSNTAIWRCKAGTGAITRYTSWVARSTSSRMVGQFSIAGVTLDAMQTNSSSAKHTFHPRAGRTYRMCGNTDDPPYSKLVKEYVS
jgi:hypothetical protein